jgi:hypothetical protein
MSRLIFSQLKWLERIVDGKVGLGALLPGFKDCFLA